MGISENSGPSELASHRPLALMFTDLVGSSKLYHERGDSMARALVATHQQLLTEQLERFEGTLIKTIGDSLMVTFSRAKLAVACAIGMQRAMAGYNQQAPPADRLHIRIGVHLGPVIVENDQQAAPAILDVHGDAVNVAARIEELAQSDQIYASLTAWQGATAVNTEVEHLGDFKLKGLSEKQALVQILWRSEDIDSARRRVLEKEMLPALARAVKQKKSILVLGGLSLGSRQASMAARVARQLSSLLGGDERRLDLARLASLYEEEFGREELLRLVGREVAEQKELPAGILGGLASLPFDLVITTDIDMRMDTALAQAGRQVKRRVRLDEAVSTQAEEGQTVLLKLFGDVQEPESLALTEDDVSVRLSMLKYAPEEFLGALATRQLFFVGFRWSDARFKRLFKALTAHTELGLIKAMGVSVKLAPGVRGTWQRRGLHLAQADEMDFARQLGKSLAALEDERRIQKEAQASHLVGSQDALPWKRPYKFLSFFQEEDEDIFFGRDEEKRKLFGQIVSHRLVVLHGASGTGKTSLLNAGVLPQLRREGYRVILRRPLKDLEQEIRLGVGQLVQETTAPGEKAAPGSDEWVSGVLSFHLHEFLAKYVATLASPLIIILDQFEEFFIRHSHKVRMAFAAQLGAIVRDKALNVRFVLSMRNDFVSHLSKFKSKVPDILHHEFLLENLSPAGMARAMEAPARLAKLSFAPGLVDRILADLGTVGSEPPPLQIICDRLYDELQEGQHEFKSEHYDRLGGAKGILGSYLERFLGTRTTEAKELTRQVLKALVTSLGTKSVVTAKDIAQEMGRPLRSIKGVLDQLIQARLVRKFGDDDGESFELSHEYLIDEIGKWIEEKDRELKKARELLRQEMVNHERFGLLMAPSRLAIIKAQAEHLKLNPAEKAFLNKSQRHFRQKHRRTAAAAVVVIAALTLGVFALLKNYRLGLCQSTDLEMAGVWDQTLKKKVETAFLATGRHNAQDTYNRVAQGLDLYLQTWHTARTEACEATMIRGTQSDQLMDLRMACLDRKRAAMKELITIFSTQADAKVVDNAVSAVTAQTSLSDCQDTRALSARVPLPKDPAVRRKVEDLRKQVDKATSLENAGKYSESYQEAQAALTVAQELDYLPIEAEVLLQLGSAEDQLAKYAQAESTLKKAVVFADVSGSDEIRANALVDLIWVVGYRQGRFDDALKIGVSAKAVLDRLHENGGLRAAFHRDIGIMYAQKSDTDQAMKHYKQALSIREKVFGPQHPTTAMVLTSMGLIFNEWAEYERSLTYFERALSIWKKSFGPDHVRAALARNNLGMVLSNQGKFDKALEYYMQVLEIFEKTLGPDHPDVATTLYNIGFAYKGKGERDKALEYFKQALGIWEKSVGPQNSDVAMVLNNIGNELRAKGDYDQALKYQKRSLKIRERIFGPDHPRVASVLINLGVLADTMGDSHRAMEAFNRSLEIYEKAPGPMRIDVAEVLINLGRKSSKKGRDNEAKDYFERVLTICGADKCQGDKQQTLSMAQFGLAQILAKNGTEVERAVQLARKARKFFQSQTSVEGQGFFREADEWLRKNESGH